MLWTGDKFSAGNNSRFSSSEMSPVPPSGKTMDAKLHGHADAFVSNIHKAATRRFVAVRTPFLICHLYSGFVILFQGKTNFFSSQIYLVNSPFRTTFSICYLYSSAFLIDCEISIILLHIFPCLIHSNTLLYFLQFGASHQYWVQVSHPLGYQPLHSLQFIFFFFLFLFIVQIWFFFAIQMTGHLIDNPSHWSVRYFFSGPFACFVWFQKKKIWFLLNSPLQDN